MNKNANKIIIGLALILFLLVGVLVGYRINTNNNNISSNSSPVVSEPDQPYAPVTISQEEAVISVVEKVSPAVVSIVAVKDVPIIQRRGMDPFNFYYDPFFDYFYEERGTERVEVGGGTGFIISSDGLVLTNRHVVADTDAEYTIFTNDGTSYEVEILARDNFQDLAMLRIKGGGNFPTVKLGNSDNLKIGQTVIAIGNSLGEFRNTVSVGVVSGLGRSISATDGRTSQLLEDVIQTDAAINSGNSGGPLLNLRGEVVGINTAMAIGAQNIGFSIPIQKAQKMIESIKLHGELIYPFLGVRYVMIDGSSDLGVDHGAFIIKDDIEPGIEPNSPAEKAGLKEGDIILEFNGQVLDSENSLAEVIVEYNPGDEIDLKVLRDGNELTISVKLGSKKI